MTDLPLEHVSRPPDDAADDRPPGLFVLHGRGADAQDLLPVVDRLPDAFHVVSLQAPRAMGPGYTWYALDLSAGGLHQSQPDAEGFRESLDLVNESVAAATTAYDLDPNHRGFIGFSQGAITATALLLEEPETVDWLAAHHGYLPASHEELDPEGIAGTPVLVGAGADDEVIPASRSEAIAERLSALGCTVTAATYEGGHGIGPAELEDLVEFATDRLGA
ncbi:MAG: alpha/beta hydrolase [Halobacteriaceae archaeon]